MVTKEQIENTLEFKILKRILLKEIPWILDVKLPSEESLNEWKTLYLNFVIDPYLIQKMFGWKIEFFVIYEVKKNKYYDSPYLAVIFDRKDKDSVINFQSNFKQLLKSIFLQTQKNIPEELSSPIFKDNFPYGIESDDYIVPPISILPIPEDTEYISSLG